MEVVVIYTYIFPCKQRPKKLNIIVSNKSMKIKGYSVLLHASIEQPL